MRVLINGVGYETSTSEFTIFATLPKKIGDYSFPSSTFRFSNGTIGYFSTFINRRGLRMLSVHGYYYGLAHNLETYLQERRADVTKYINSVVKSF